MRTNKQNSSGGSSNIIFLTFFCIAAMNTALYILVLQFFFVADAQTQRQLRTRKADSNTLICIKLSPETYETKSVSRLKALTSTTSGLAVHGACQKTSVCRNLCESFDSFEIIESKCRCISNDAIPTPPPLTCGLNAELTPDGKSCECISGYEGDALTACTEREIVMCANPYGNPCGPNSACTDTPTGISCTPANLNGCPAGCGPNSTCLNNGDGAGYQCECDLGFYRKESYLPCEAGP